jgi:hypothetical protein
MDDQEKACTQERRQVQECLPGIIEDNHWSQMVDSHLALLFKYDCLMQLLWNPHLPNHSAVFAKRGELPSRFWSAAIAPCLELLHHQPRPARCSKRFFYEAYHLTAMYTERIEVYKAWWFECLGKLCAYQMNRVSENQDMETWRNIGYYWYARACAERPSTGTLYIGLSNMTASATQQACWVLLSSTCASPCASARAQLFSLLQGRHDTFLLVHHAFLHDCERFHQPAFKFLKSLNSRIDTINWMKEGVFIAAINITQLVGFSMASSKRITPGKLAAHLNRVSGSVSFVMLRNFVFAALGVVLGRTGESLALPYIYVSLTFVHYLAVYSLDSVLCAVPWERIVQLLNILRQHNIVEKASSEDLDYYLPEDTVLTGMPWALRSHRRQAGFTVESLSAHSLAQCTKLLDLRLRKVYELGCLISKVWTFGLEWTNANEAQECDWIKTGQLDEYILDSQNLRLACRNCSRVSS